MCSFVEALALWPSLATLASDLGLPYGVVKQWRLRNSIPSAHWRALVAAAQARGIGGVNIDTLAAIAAKRAEAA